MGEIDRDLLTDEQRTHLEKLVKEITNEVEKVVKDYKENPSEMSGSITQVHENSPLLNEKKLDSNT